MTLYNVNNLIHEIFILNQYILLIILFDTYIFIKNKIKHNIKQCKQLNL